MMLPVVGFQHKSESDSCARKSGILPELSADSWFPHTVAASFKVSTDLGAFALSEPESLEQTQTPTAIRYRSFTPIIPQNTNKLLDSLIRCARFSQTASFEAMCGIALPGAVAYNERKRIQAKREKKEIA